MQNGERLSNHCLQICQSIILTTNPCIDINKAIRTFYSLYQRITNVSHRPTPPRCGLQGTGPHRRPHALLSLGRNHLGNCGSLQKNRSHHVPKRRVAFMGSAVPHRSSPPPQRKHRHNPIRLHQVQPTKRRTRTMIAPRNSLKHDDDQDNRRWYNVPHLQIVAFSVTCLAGALIAAIIHMAMYGQHSPSPEWIRLTASIGITVGAFGLSLGCLQKYFGRKE